VLVRQQDDLALVEMPVGAAWVRQHVEVFEHVDAFLVGDVVEDLEDLGY
jgi:hypothetical protein